MKEKPETITYNPEWRPEWSPKWSRDRYRWVENASRGLRVAGYVDEITPPDWAGRRPMVDHKGWFLDDEILDCREIARGVVLRLPHGRLVPAVEDPNNPDCYIVCFGDATEDMRDVIRRADNMAKRYAEAERDYRTRDRAEMALSDTRERIGQARAEVHALAREMRELRDLRTDAPNICAVLRQRIASTRREVRNCVKRIKELRDNPYSILEGA